MGAGFLLNEFIETIHEDNISSFDNLLRGLGVQRSCYNNQWAKIKIIIKFNRLKIISLGISMRRLSVAKKIPQGYE